jgi:polysaccharide deacetylase 2 family uncharacterized protein YibQ
MISKERRYETIIGVLLIVVIINIVFFTVSIRPKRREVLPPAQIKGKIAIVLDDWGYNLNNLAAAKSINLPFTAAVLPNLKYSKAVASELHEHGCEIILHLPMQPREKWNLEKDTVSVSMSGSAVKKILEKDLSSLVYVDGVSNHMGSLATENPKVMTEVLGVLKEKKLFFLDSYVTSRSAVPELARKMNVPFAKRDIFLDNKNDADYIRQQLLKLKARARSRGWAVGIGHDRKVTLEVLGEMMPRLDKEGYKFVFVSEIAR